MICKCGGYMFLDREYAGDYWSPSEKIYKCNKCKGKVVIQENCEDWSGIEEEFQLENEGWI